MPGPWCCRAWLRPVQCSGPSAAAWGFWKRHCTPGGEGENLCFQALSCISLLHVCSYSFFDFFSLINWFLHFFFFFYIVFVLLPYLSQNNWKCMPCDLYNGNGEYWIPTVHMSKLRPCTFSVTSKCSILCKQIGTLWPERNSNAYMHSGWSVSGTMCVKSGTEWDWFYPTFTVNSGAHRVHGKHPMAWHYHAKQKVQKKPILGTFSREESEPWWSLIDVASLFAFSVLILIFINFNFSKQKLLTYNAMHSHTFFNLCFLCPFAQVMNHHRFYQQ